MNNSLGTLLQKLRTTSWRDWSIYSIFVVTFVGLWWLADEVHWQSDVFQSSLSVADDGRLIGAVTATDQSMYRNRFYLFDENLQLKRSIRLRSEYSWGQHSLSQDGKYLLYVVGDSNPWIGSDGLNFERLSLNGSPSPARIALPDADVVKVLGREWKSNGVLGLQLIGDPPNQFLLRTSSDLFLVELSGQIVSCLDWTYYGSTINSKYTTTTIPKAQGLYLTAYKVHSDELQPIFQKRINTDPRQHRFAANSNGLLAIQYKSHVLINDLQIEEKSNSETVLPWSMVKGKLIAISDDGATLLFDGEKRLYAVSTLTQSVVGELSLPGPVKFNQAALLGNHRVVIDKTSSDGKQRGLMIWDWKDSTTKEVSFGNHSDMANRAIDWAFIVSVSIWAGAFFRYAAVGSYPRFGIAVLIAAVVVLVRWAHLAPEAERLIIYFERVHLLVPPVLCQVGLSVVSVWAFRYLSLALASALTVGLASYAACWYHLLAGDGFGCYFIDGRFYFQNMVLVFAIEMILVQSLLAVGSLKKLTLTISDLLILTVATAVVVGLLKKIIFENQDQNTIIFGLAGGKLHLIVTFYAVRRSMVSFRWPQLLWLPLVATGYFAFLYLIASVLYVYLFNIGVLESVSFWLTLGLSHFVVFLLTWALLRLAYRFLEQPFKQGQIVTQPA